MAERRKDEEGELRNRGGVVQQGVSGSSLERFLLDQLALLLLSLGRNLKTLL